MKKEDFKFLLEKYSKGECTDQECRSIERYILKNPKAKNWHWKDTQSKADTYKLIKDGLPMLKQRRSPSYHVIRWAMSAAVVLLMIASVWFLKTKNTERTQSAKILVEAKEFSSDQVTITLPNGEIRELDGKFFTSELDNLTPDLDDRITTTWITIQVPNGKSQEVVLSDGSSVWLNAGSKLRFPQVFDKDKRDVSLVGEGYFEVMHSSSKPFHVSVGNGEVEVTGTKFNVQAYNDENIIRTSLVEGGVNFSMDKEKHKIYPGYELITDLESKSTLYQKFNVNQLTSWKDGFFTFDNMSFLEVMKMVSRWYNISVVTDVKIDNIRIGGTYPTDLPLQELLNDISLISGIKFELDGKEVRIVNNLTKKNF